MTGQHDTAQDPTVPVGVPEPDWLEQAADVDATDADAETFDESGTATEQSPGDADEPDRIEQSMPVGGDEDYPREPDDRHGEE